MESASVKINSVQTLREKILQRRNQMLVHSCIYYRLNTELISDHQWQTWANELRDLQALFGYQMGYYDEEFKDWDGSTGYHLPNGEPAIVARAIRLLTYAGLF